MHLLTEETLAACSLNGESVVLCAFSGGPDSTALLLELVRQRDEGRLKQVYAAHLNHGIRPTAGEDMAFCRRLCLSLGVSLFCESRDVPAVAKERGLSLETAARQVRHGFLDRVSHALGDVPIALGHHRGDQAETVLLHLIRGSGLRGLAAMSLRQGRLVRPLLSTSKEEIAAYLSERNQPYCLDETNADAAFARNRLRLTILPALEAIHPGARENICACAHKLAQEDAFLEDLAQKAYVEAGGSRRRLMALPMVLQLRIALWLIRRRTADYTQADAQRLVELFRLPSGSRVTLRGGLVARAEGDSLRFDEEPPAVSDLPLTVGQEVQTPFGCYRTEWVNAARLPCSADQGYIDARAICGRLFLHQAQAGERFVPLGMAGSKLLSDYYTDRHMGQWERKTPLLMDEKGPLFVPLGTVAQRARIQEDSHNILHIHFIKGGKNNEQDL